MGPGQLRARKLACVSREEHLGWPYLVLLKFVGYIVVPHIIITRSVVMVWHWLLATHIINVFLILLVFEAVPSYDVLDAENMLWASRGETSAWYEDSSGVGHPPVLRKIGDLLFCLRLYLGFCLGDQIRLFSSTSWVECADNTGNNI